MKYTKKEEEKLFGKSTQESFEKRLPFYNELREKDLSKINKKEHSFSANQKRKNNMNVTIDFYNPAHITIIAVVIFLLLLNAVMATDEDCRNIFSVITTAILMIASGCTAIGSVCYLLFYAITQLA